MLIDISLHYTVWFHYHFYSVSPVHLSVCVNSVLLERFLCLLLLAVWKGEGLLAFLLDPPKQQSCKKIVEALPRFHWKLIRCTRPKTVNTICKESLQHCMIGDSTKLYSSPLVRHTPCPLFQPFFVFYFLFLWNCVITDLSFNLILMLDLLPAFNKKII